jgi:hypothetical protein
LRIVRRIAAFLLIVGPIGGLIGVTEAGAAYPSTTTVLSAVTASTTYGSEAQTFTVTVTGDPDLEYGAPLGTVTVYAGASDTNELCSTSTLVALSGGPPADATEYQCADSATALPAGNYTDVYAVFVAGTPSSTENGVNYNGSTSTPAQTIGVNPEQVTTASISLAISPGTVDVGAENVTGLFTVTVTGISGDGYPTGAGAVTLSDTACTPVLTGNNGNDVSTWTCTLTASQLVAGTYSGITATYTAPTCPTAAASTSSSNGNYCYSNVGPSAGETLQVNTLETTSSNLVVAPTSVQLGNENTVVFTDTVTGVSGDGYPLGTVTVTSGSTTLCSTSSISSNPTAYQSVFVCSTTNGSALPVGPNQFIQAAYVPGAPGSSSSVTGFDYSGSNGDAALTVTAPPPVPPVITSPAPGTLPDGTVGVPYSVTLTATSGTPPYNWSVPPGTLPPGLSLGPLSGQITGTPTTNGTYTFTVTVTDANSLTNSQTYTITIGPALVITANRLPNGNHGRAYSAQITTSGGITPLHFSISGGKLPPGLGINANTGVISGSAGATGTYTFTVEVTDTTVPVSQVAYKTFTITIS